MTQKTINQRLNFLIENLGLSIRAFSATLGVSDTNTRNYLAKGTKPNSDYLESILRHFSRVNPTWLLLGEGEPFLDESAQTTVSNVAHVKKNQGIAINNGNATISLEACEKELEIARRDITAYQREIELLRGQLEAKDALIAAKEEVLVLLRGGHNRPN